MLFRYYRIVHSPHPWVLPVVLPEVVAMQPAGCGCNATTTIKAQSLSVLTWETSTQSPHHLIQKLSLLKLNMTSLLHQQVSTNQLDIFNNSIPSALWQSQKQSAYSKAEEEAYLHNTKTLTCETERKDMPTQQNCFIRERSMKVCQRQRDNQRDNQRNDLGNSEVEPKNEPQQHEVHFKRAYLHRAFTVYLVFSVFFQPLPWLTNCHLCTHAAIGSYHCWCMCPYTVHRSNLAPEWSPFS